MEVKYLLKVEPQANNNKYYKMIPHGNTWTAEYGRVGSNPQKREYSESQWNKKYREKINKGYIDQTELVSDVIGKEEKNGEGQQYKEIENHAIAKIVDRLQNMAKKAITDNYTISSDKVTKKMVNEAQKLIKQLLTISDISEFNDTLVYLFSVIPRKMTSVADSLAESEDDFGKIIQKEQDLLDVMKGQVVETKMPKVKSDSISSQTILEAMGLEIEECTEEDVEVIRNKLGGCAKHFKQAWRVKNIETSTKFDEYVMENNIKHTKLLWHGSRNENWWSIINSGLVLKPTNAVITGKMFDYGIYYATKARKSLGYTSLSGSIYLFRFWFFL